MEFCPGGFEVWSNGDFSECFEDFALFGILNLLFCGAAAMRIMQLANYPLVEVPRSRVHITKVVLSGAMAVLPLVIIFHQLVDGTNRPFQIVWSATMTLTWAFSLVVLHREYQRALPHNWVLRVFWLLTFCVGCFKLRTVIRGHHMHPPTVTSFDFYMYLLLFIIMLIMTVLGIFFRKSHEAFDKYAVLPQMNEHSQHHKFYGLNLLPLLHLVRPELPLIALGVFCGVVSAILFMIQPYLIGRIIDDVTEQREADSKNRLNTFAAILISLYACDAVFHGSHMVLFHVAAERAACRLKTATMRAILVQEMAFFDDHNAGELLGLIDDDTGTIQRAVGERLSSALTQIINVVSGFLFVFILSWKLTLVMLAMAPVAALCQIANNKIVKGLNKRGSEAKEKSLLVAEEALHSIRTVRAFSKDEREAARYGAATALSYRLARKTSVIRGVCESGAMFAMNSCIVMGLWYGGLLVLRGPTELGGGELTAYILYTLYIVFAVTQLMGLGSVVARAGAAASRITAVLKRKPQMDHRGGLIFDRLKGEIEFQNVFFSFPSRVDGPSLSDISFSVAEKSRVVLVGPASGGKTTIAALLERFYDPQQGRIVIDAKDLSSYDPRWIRDQIGIVTHDPPMFANSVAKNIGYSRDDATLAEIVEAARQACAHEFICSLPDGYQTVIGEHNVRLTSDQKIRIAVARAMLKNPSLVVVVEGSVDLDSEQEQNVQAAMSNLYKNRTCLIIANRLPTMKAADKILVVKGGKVVQEGGHAVLMEQEGFYRSLVTRAMEGEPTAAGAASSEISLMVSAEPEPLTTTTNTTNIDHQSKSESANLKLREAADMAERLEEKLKAGDFDVLQLVAQLKRTLAQV